MPTCELTKKISNILVLYQILLIFAQKYTEMKLKEIQYISPDLFAPKDAWDKLSMAEKAEMMKVAVRNGITNLQEIRKKYNEFAEGGDISDEEYIDTMEKVAEENYKKWGFNNPDEALVHALNDNTYNYRGYYNKYPQSSANADTHWTDEFKTVYHPTFSNQSIYSGKKSQYNPNGRTGGFWLGEDLFVPAPWQLFSDYASGGKIHIKPENRGKFTRLKERTGHSATWFKEHGTPAQKKMATFALNARKWKHGEGGYINLFGEGGEGNPMNYEHRGTIYDDELKRQGITHIAELPEVTITGRDLKKPYFSAFDGSAEPYIELFGALSKGLQPLSISQHVGAAFDAAQGERNYFESLFNGNSGFFTDKYVTKHPWVSTFGNMAGDIATPLLLSKAPAAYRSGIRFMQNVDDRYQGMKDAAEYAANKSIKGNSAADITNYIWTQREGVKASDGLIRPATKYRTGIKLAKKEAEDNYGLLSEAGGNQTINVHLGGAHYGDKPWELVAMEYPKKKWASRFFSTAPKGTVFGELGKTKNFAEQYTEIHPNRWKAFKDALINKTEVNPYWDDFEQSITERIKTASDPAVKAYYQNLLNGNNPLSIDSYKMMMDLTKKGKYALRYDSKPMGMFNSQGVKQRHVYEELQQMSPKEQVDAINNWLMTLNPKARPAYLQNGELMIPRPLLYKNTPSNNTWLKSK